MDNPIDVRRIDGEPLGAGACRHEPRSVARTRIDAENAAVAAAVGAREVERPAFLRKIAGDVVMENRHRPVRDPPNAGARRLVGGKVDLTAERDDVERRAGLCDLYDTARAVFGRLPQLAVPADTDARAPVDRGLVDRDVPGRLVRAGDDVRGAFAGFALALPTVAAADAAVLPVGVEARRWLALDVRARSPVAPIVAGRPVWPSGSAGLATERCRV